MCIIGHVIFEGGRIVNGMDDAVVGMVLLLMLMRHANI